MHQNRTRAGERIEIPDRTFVCPHCMREFLPKSYGHWTAVAVRIDAIGRIRAVEYFLCADCSRDARGDGFPGKLARMSLLRYVQARESAHAA